MISRGQVPATEAFCEKFHCGGWIKPALAHAGLSTQTGSPLDYSKIITVEPGKRSGQRCIRGMRFTVKDVFQYLVGGMSIEELLADFPDLTREDVLACFAQAADRQD